MLAQASQLSNRKLRDIADAVVYEGDLPRQGRRGQSQSDFGAVG